ncbi:MAG: sulfite exporter TauE/SafE family protein [Alphaproteobacteria bacterium]|nr:sulfite exporter TauE/SafE family protein [Alphaproteobacteria bacterium]
MNALSLQALLPSLDPLLIASICGIFIFAGIVKGFLGIGLPAAAMGLLTLIFPPTEAISLLWLPILFSNMFQFGRARNKREIAVTYKWFAAAIFISIFLTSLFINDYPTALLTVAIGVAMVVFSMNLLFGLSLPVGPGRGWQVGVGIVSGVLGGLSSIWSPPVAMYLMARNTPKDMFIGATGFLFLAGCLPLGVGLVISGLITGPVIVKSLLGLLMTLIGFRIGEILRERISQDRFRQVVLVAFLIMGGRLITTGLL